VTLEPTRADVSEAAADEFMPVEEPISGRTLDLLHARTAADALVYRDALTAHSTDAEAEEIRHATFAAQVVRLGDNSADKSAASSQSLARRLTENESEVASFVGQLNIRQEELSQQRETISRLEEELAQQRSWFKGIQGPVSWWMTDPLRAAKRRVLEAKPA
jgi:hypothetical protein